MKERIIGAVVLVIFVVLVVPIFLDGPPGDEETVQQTVLLPGQSEQETRTVVLDRDRTNPSPPPVSSAPADDPTEDRTTPATEVSPEPIVAEEDSKPEETPAETAPAQVAETVTQREDPAPAPEETAPQAISSTGMWAVQLGSFSSRDNAEALANTLRRQAYAAFVSQVSTANGTMHRVRVGPQKDRTGAEQMAARLARVGHNGQVVPHP